MTARARLVGGVLALASMLVGCDGATPTDDRAGMDAQIGDRSRPRVVATTAVLGDVVGAVGGEAIALTVLIPPGVDPHAFEPAPADAIALEDADLIFVNGFDLEESLLPLLDERVAAGARVVSASAGIAARVPRDGSCDEAEGSEDHEAEDAAHGHRDEPCAPDPHVWLDPTNVARWAATIAEHLSVVDPARAGDYAARAAGVEARMGALDAWIRARIATVPADRMRFVADHSAYGWFADRYGLEMVGAVLPGFSTLAGASAGELAALQDSIAALDVPAIFVTLAVADDLAARLAADTGIRVVPLYTGSLSQPDGPAASYEAMMRHDVTLMVTALGGDVVER